MRYLFVLLSLTLFWGCVCWADVEVPVGPNQPVDVICPVECNSVASPHVVEDSNGPLTLEKILAHTQGAAKALSSLQCNLVYEYVSIYDSTTTRKGGIAYQRDDSNSILRVHYDTKRMDETPEAKYREDLIFDGVWWTHVDYEGRSIQKHQLAPEEHPMDAMDLATQYVPIFGFSGVNQWRDRYVVTWLKDTEDPNASTSTQHLRMTPHNPDDETNDYLRVDVWLDPNGWMPTLVEAENLDEEIYRLHFQDVKINQSLPAGTFTLVIPEGFGDPEITPLN